MSELLELAARVAAHNPADVDVGDALGREVIEAAADGGIAFWTLASPLYSLDAARSLVPEGWEWRHWRQIEPLDPAHVGWTKVATWHPTRSYCGFGVDVPEAIARTLELALTAAALRARAGGGE